jgi:uncharacterized membrane protein YgcG
LHEHTWILRIGLAGLAEAGCASAIVLQKALKNIFGKVILPYNWHSSNGRNVPFRHLFRRMTMLPENFPCNQVFTTTPFWRHNALALARSVALVLVFSVGMAGFSPACAQNAATDARNAMESARQFLPEDQRSGFEKNFPDPEKNFSDTERFQKSLPTAIEKFQQIAPKGKNTGFGAAADSKAAANNAAETTKTKNAGSGSASGSSTGSGSGSASGSGSSTGTGSTVASGGSGTGSASDPKLVTKTSSFNVRNDFSVAGVKVGMDYRAAITGLGGFFQVGDSKIPIADCLGKDMTNKDEWSLCLYGKSDSAYDGCMENCQKDNDACERARKERGSKCQTANCSKVCERPFDKNKDVSERGNFSITLSPTMFLSGRWEKQANVTCLAYKTTPGGSCGGPGGRLTDIVETVGVLVRFEKGVVRDVIYRDRGPNSPLNTNAILAKYGTPTTDIAKLPGYKPERGKYEKAWCTWYKDYTDPKLSSIAATSSTYVCDAMKAQSWVIFYPEDGGLVLAGAEVEGEDMEKLAKRNKEEMEAMMKALP